MEPDHSGMIGSLHPKQLPQDVNSGVFDWEKPVRQGEAFSP